MKTITLSESQIKLLIGLVVESMADLGTIDHEDDTREMELILKQLEDTQQMRLI